MNPVKPPCLRSCKTVVDRRNCPHKGRIAVGVDILDGDDGRPVVVHKGMRCTACGDVKAVDALIEEDRMRKCEHGVPFGAAAMIPCERCVARNVQAGEEARLRGHGPRVVALAGPCPHGVKLTAPQPCFVCIAETLLEGKKARELAHAIASCTHETQLRHDRITWCTTCGARRIPATSHWMLPALAQRAKALDVGAASSGPAAEPSPADSSPKNDT